LEGVFPKSDGDILYDGDVNELFNMSPIGSVTAWLKSYTNVPTLPDNWVECNGQTLTDADSLFNGQAIPDLNGFTGTQNFLRGGGASDGSTPTASGATGGAETHTHTISKPGSNASGSGETGYTGTTAATASSSSSLPTNYEVVWIIRIK